MRSTTKPTFGPSDCERGQPVEYPELPNSPTGNQSCALREHADSTRVPSVSRAAAPPWVASVGR
eukprot:5303747-Prymnesium_polylepis.2